MNFLKFGFFAVMLSMTFFITACGGSADTESPDSPETEQHEEGHDGHDHDGEENEAEVGMDSKEYTSAYICPMHCEGSGSDTEGKCPTCGMDYVKKENHNEDNHDH